MSRNSRIGVATEITKSAGHRGKKGGPPSPVGKDRRGGGNGERAFRNLDAKAKAPLKFVKIEQLGGALGFTTKADGRGDTLYFAMGWNPREAWIALARGMPAARKAVELAPSLPEVLAAMGMLPSLRLGALYVPRCWRVTVQSFLEPNAIQLADAGRHSLNWRRV